MCASVFFFFFKQKTAYEMRISDRSSDVCSSDLTTGARQAQSAGAGGRSRRKRKATMVDFKREALVSTAWLADNLAAPDLRVVDASYYLPNEGLDGRREFEAHHIPGAVFFDIDAIKDPASALPHMLPPPHIFSSKVRKPGLGDGLRFVIYDQRGIFSAPRVWWTFRYLDRKST